MYIWDFISLVLGTLSHRYVLIGVTGAVLSPFCLWGMKAQYGRQFVPQTHVRLPRAAGRQILTQIPHAPPKSYFDDCHCFCNWLFAALRMKRDYARSHRVKLREKRLSMGVGGRKEDFPNVNCVLFCKERVSWRHYSKVHISWEVFCCMKMNIR